jgi:hypothetical protein
MSSQCLHLSVACKKRMWELKYLSLGHLTRQWQTSFLNVEITSSIGQSTKNLRRLIEQHVMSIC